ncbi:MAG: hypothetical protein P9M13_07355 [Candidatus Ancaeobacter aquaticus]|nr:hypothetical protein [Candidatus Ancaeobacter aquaticus]
MKLIFPAIMLLIGALVVACAHAQNLESEQNKSQPSYTIMDAEKRGGFDIGPAVSGVTTTFAQDLLRDVVKFDFAASPKSYTGVFTKGYPQTLNASSADAVTIGIKAKESELIKQVAVKIEIKGPRGIQTVPILLKNGWNYTRVPINWDGIGSLSEIVFVITPIIKTGQVEGILYLDAEFFTLTFFEKYWTFIKVGVVIALCLLIFLLVGILRLLFGRKSRAKSDIPVIDTNIGGFFTLIKTDLLYGIVSFILIGSALWLYNLGTVNHLNAGFNYQFIFIALIGVFLADILKAGHVGRHLTAGEAFQTALISGLLAASSSSMEILQAPASWAGVLTLNKVLATIFFLVYHISNACAIAGRGKVIRPITGLIIVLAPYTLNWLMVSENALFIQNFINSVTGNILAAQPIIMTILGRLFVVFIFNEIFVNSMSLATTGKLMKDVKGHIIMFLVALYVSCGSLIADFGSTEAVSMFPLPLMALAVIVASALSFGGLWAEVYLITGVALDGGKRNAPSGTSLLGHVTSGLKKGIAYSTILMTLLFIVHIMLNVGAMNQLMKTLPLVIGVVVGSLVFPLIKTIIESFDGSLPFLARARYSYKDGVLYARGAVVGFGFAYALSNGFIQQAMHHRILFGLIVGLIASSGISIVRDAFYASKNQGKIQSWRLYFIDGLMGAFVGCGVAFYLDALQVPVVVEKFKLYTSSGFEAREYVTYPLVNKWGRIDLGTFTGGAKLLYTESLAGVINWSIAAWLFAINKAFLQMILDKHTAPVRNFFSKEGFGLLVENMIFVLRWGLWMSPIIFTFLRMMPDPTWYNQDGAVRTMFAIYHDATMSPAAFREWSLQVFVYILAFDFFRVLIWMDHMGLRVASLVNLSFIGLDKLDEKIAKFIGPAAAQRYIPEGVKRFATWAPLLIPFFIPRGREWASVWNTAAAIQSAAELKEAGLLSSVMGLGVPQKIVFVIVAIFICAVLSYLFRALRRRSLRKKLHVNKLNNRMYRVFLKENGEIYSEIDHKKPTVFPKEYDLSRRSYDTMDPCGRVLYMVDTKAEGGNVYWPLIGNFPHDKFKASDIKMGDEVLHVKNDNNGIKTKIDITLPDQFATTEIWNVTIKNTTDQEKELKLVPYLEWVLNGGLHDRFHTQYTRLLIEMEYVREKNAVLAWQKSTKSMGILAADVGPDGFLTSRMDFIGRAQSIWRPRILDTMDYSPARDTEAYPSFEPIGSLFINATVKPKETKTIRLMIGYAKKRDEAIKMIDTFLKPTQSETIPPEKVKKNNLLIGHGEILPGTPQPYSEYIDDGNKILVKTPYTPRPFDHAMSNPLHSVMVTNRGLHTSCNGNSQQNRLTPDWPDTCSQELPAEAIYLYDVDRKEWYSPCYYPLFEKNASYESEFGVDGTAVFRMGRGTLATELTVFVPQDEPLGIYYLTIKNHSEKPRKMRMASYFEMVLEFMPEKSGVLQKRIDKAMSAIYYKNPRNLFRRGWAFASMSVPSNVIETKRGRFFGKGRGISHPYLVENGTPDTSHLSDNQQIAGLLTTIEIPARDECTIAIVMGQADTKREAKQLVQKYKNIENVEKTLTDTRNWWLSLMTTVRFETSHQEFNYLQNWLKYQGLAERIWARRGFYQTSGAFGFRDQLQDTVNLMWVDPALARKQILLHASQQFPEGDVFHWFFTLTDGRTAFSCRTHASDNPAWLPWAVVEYTRCTGDKTLLDEKTTYAESEFPFAPLPANLGGIGHMYHRSTRSDTVYKHCLKSLDLILTKRTGENGLPHIRTGDWNDGLDEIGSHGKGESVWLGFFVYYILKNMVDIIGEKEGDKRKAYYVKKMNELGESIEKTWREDRYLRAFHDDGTEIGIKGSGIWETDALTAAWAVMADINFDHAVTAFNTSLSVLERENTILLGWPALREDSKPYLGRSSKYPEGVRENGMYCHGVQWLVKAARLLAEKFEQQGNQRKADEYRAAAYRLWMKIAPIAHCEGDEIERYGGQPNKQCADILTNYEVGRMIWHGYTGAAGWMIRQAMEGIVGATLVNNEMIVPGDLEKPRGDLKIYSVVRDLTNSPIKKSPKK